MDLPGNWVVRNAEGEVVAHTASQDAAVYFAAEFGTGLYPEYRLHEMRVSA